MSASQHLLQQHSKNLLYFQKFYPNLYIKLKNHQKTSTYELTIEENSYFDIEDTKTGSYIYGSNSEEFSQQFVDQILSKNQNKISKKVVFGGTLLGIHIEKYLQTVDADIMYI